MSGAGKRVRIVCVLVSMPAFAAEHRKQNHLGIDWRNEVSGMLLRVSPELLTEVGGKLAEIEAKSSWVSSSKVAEHPVSRRISIRSEMMKRRHEQNGRIRRR